MDRGGLRVILSGGIPVAGWQDSQADVEISADRGDWSIALRLPGMVEFADTHVLAAHLDGSEIAEPDIAEQARFVKQRLGEAAAAAEADPSIDAALRQLSEAYMRERLGITDPAWPPPESRHW